MEQIIVDGMYALPIRRGPNTGRRGNFQGMYCSEYGGNRHTFEEQALGTHAASQPLQAYRDCHTSADSERIEPTILDRMTHASNLLVAPLVITGVMTHLQTIPPDTWTSFSHSPSLPGRVVCPRHQVNRSGAVTFDSPSRDHQLDSRIISSLYGDELATPYTRLTCFTTTLGSHFSPH
ncbi:hypothetical protein APHAL10511_008059 [Amanita phalloides]|nr:hypothetical protein APHAL10511_008059 [Amanita phalloides]